MGSWLLFRQHWVFWVAAGSIGFGIFYSGLCLGADYVPGWAVATTWQSTVLATPLVLRFFGKRVSGKGVLLTLLTFLGVLLVNFEQLRQSPTVLWGAIPVLMAAFAYPIGNQMVWEAGHEGLGRIPRIDHPLMRSAVVRILLLAVGSLPYWVILGAILQPPLPTSRQLFHVWMVAVLSGVIASSVFYYARQHCKNAYELMAMDSTQALQVVFVILAEKLFLGIFWPGIIGIIGIACVLLGQLIFFLQKPPSKLL